MKREDIEKVLRDLGVDDEEKLKKVVDGVMVEYGKAFKDKDQEIDKLKTTNEGLNTQLKETNDKIQELSKVDVEDMTKQLKELNDKYETDTKALQDKISQQEYEYKVKELTNDLKFSSESAKKNFLREITDKQLKLEDGKLVGFNDFVDTYKKNDPSAFVVEKNKDDKVYSLGGTHTKENTDNKKPTTLTEELRENYKQKD